MNGTLVIAAAGIVFGIVSGSFSILFDGVYALIDATMGGLALLVTRLILRDALKRDEDARAGCATSSASGIWSRWCWR